MKLRQKYCLKNELFYLKKTNGIFSLTRIFLCILLLNFIINFSHSATLVDYTEKEVWDYVRHIPRENLTKNCAASLDKVKIFLIIN